MRARDTDPSTDTGRADTDPDQSELFGDADSPGFARRGRVTDEPARNTGWRIAVAVLLPLLIVLVFLAQWPRLAVDPQWRPRLQSLCERIGCVLPPWRELSALRLTSRDFRAHPSASGALLVTATFRNEAAFAQPWPLLEVSLSDLRGARIGARRFSAEEYLGRAPESPTLQAGQSVQLVLELVDPAEETVAFSLDFR